MTVTYVTHRQTSIVPQHPKILASGPLKVGAFVQLTVLW